MTNHPLATVRLSSIATLAAALAGLLVSACSDAGLPAEPSSGGAAGQTANVAATGAPCVDGEVQACKLWETSHNGVVSCAAGVMTCAHGAFGACEPPTGSAPSNDPAPTIFVATCDAPLVARWSHLTWSADTTAAASIRISVQALPSPGSAGAPRPAAPMTVAQIVAAGAGDPATCASASCGDLTAVLGDAAYAGRLRVSAHVDGAKAGGGPALVNLAALFDCVAR